MMLKNRQRGFGEIEILTIFTIFTLTFIASFILTSVVTHSKDVAKKTEVNQVTLKHEVLQPVVTELKDYKGLDTQKSSITKLSPVISPAMNKEPIKPIAPEPVVTPVPQSIIEQNENHYHFEDLNSGITYLATILLVIFLLFCSFKGLGKIVNNLAVKKAIKLSQQILSSFESDINNSNTYLEYSKKIMAQLSFNRIVFEQHKTSNHIPALTVVHEQLLSNLQFAERSLVTDMRTPS